MIKRFFSLLILPLVIFSCEAEHKNEVDVYHPEAAKSFRDSLYTKLVNENILAGIKENPNPENYENWKGVFWAAGLINYKSEMLNTRLGDMLSEYKQLPNDMRRGLLEAVITLYPGDFSELFGRLIVEESNPKLSAMLAYNLQLAGVPRNEILSKLKSVYKTLNGHPILVMTQAYLSVTKPEQLANKPPLKSLINKTAPGNTVLFSFQRANRELPGLLLIRKSDGTFVKEKEGKIFSVPQFARAASDMPGYLTNGNTPMGVLSFTGFGKSENMFIGPTENLQLRLPFEAEVPEYFHGNSDSQKWDLLTYQNLLPIEWRGFTPILEAFYAGQAGRTEIIAHGTTIDPNYYKKEIYYPNTPSLGCLTAFEEWDADGKRVKSNQQKLINVLHANDISHGYFVVVDVDDKMLAVTLPELENNYPGIFD